MLVLCLIFLGISLFWIIEGISKYGFMENSLPTMGFFPILAGILVFSLSLVCLIKSIFDYRSGVGRQSKSEDTSSDPLMVSFVPKKWIPLAALIYSGILVLIFYYVGVITAVFLTGMSWMIGICRKSFFKAFIFSIVISAIIYGVFVLWLNTPFPNALLI